MTTYQYAGKIIASSRFKGCNGGLITVHTGKYSSHILRYGDGCLESTHHPKRNEDVVAICYVHGKSIIVSKITNSTKMAIGMVNGIGTINGVIDMCKKHSTVNYFRTYFRFNKDNVYLFTDKSLLTISDDNTVSTYCNEKDLIAATVDFF